jgi:hypothetical protein
MVRKGGGMMSEKCREEKKQDINVSNISISSKKC